MSDVENQKLLLILQEDNKMNNFMITKLTENLTTPENTTTRIMSEGKDDSLTPADIQNATTIIADIPSLKPDVAERTLDMIKENKTTSEPAILISAAPEKIQEFTKNDTEQDFKVFSKDQMPEVVATAQKQLNKPNGQEITDAQSAQITREQGIIKN